MPSCCCISADSFRRQRLPALCISAGVVSAVPLIRSFALRTSLTVYAAAGALSLDARAEKARRGGLCRRLRPVSDREISDREPRPPGARS
ncbi:MAG: hypothetical protein ACLR4Z_18845 [Butyricicoccaceae bacterium]